MIPEATTPEPKLSDAAAFEATTSALPAEARPAQALPETTLPAEARAATTLPAQARPAEAPSPWTWSSGAGGRRRSRRFDQRIGPYRLVRELGRGGMGVVFLAERADGVIEREVAVKILPMARIRAFGERFAQERQILAHLDHPGIARLLDAGSTEGGLPYLVMEHVEGETIERYCQTRWLSLEARLRLFIEVCEAVEAAHRSLVVHRDIKPSNILVTTAGRPKLLDFGIAKLIAGDGAASQPPTSGMLTLEWASPEQVQGEPTTVQSDVYQLGLLLHVLLTGRLPYALEGLSPMQQVVTICERQASPPSSTLRRLAAQERASLADELQAPGPLEKRFKGDLDAIVLEALRKDARHRYDSVKALRRDVERHLEQLPITARLPTLGYRTGRFLVRQRFAVAAAALALFAFILLGIFSFARITSERNLARAEALRAEQREKESRAVTEFLAGLLERSNPHDASSRRGELTVREALDLGVEQLETDLHDSPLVRARVLARLGNLFNILGDTRRSLEMNREAAALFLGFGVRGDREHIETLINLGIAYQDLADLDAAQARFHEALVYAYQTRDRLLASTILSNMAITADMQGRLDVAGRYFDAALGSSEGIEAEQARIQRTLLLANLGIFNKNLGVERADAAALEKAERHLRRALDELEDLPELASRRAMVRMNLGNVLYEMGRHQAAEATLRRALHGLQNIFDPQSPQVAMGRSNLGRALTALGHFAEAELELEQALAVRERLFGDHPKVAIVLGRLGDLRLAEERASDALPLLERALEIRQAAHSDRHPALARAHRSLARCLRELGRPDEAAGHLERAAAIFEAGGFPEQAAEMRRRLAKLSATS